MPWGLLGGVVLAVALTSCTAGRTGAAPPTTAFHPVGAPVQGAAASAQDACGLVEQAVGALRAQDPVRAVGLARSAMDDADQAVQAPRYAVLRRDVADFLAMAFHQQVEAHLTGRPPPIGRAGDATIGALGSHCS